MSTSRKRWALAAAALGITSLVPLAPAAAPVHAAPGDTGEIVALVIDGVGNGHGRGLSQYGSFGWAVNYGWGWQQILDHYYGPANITSNVAPADFLGVANGRMTVRLNGVDNLQTAVVSSKQLAHLGGSGPYGTIVAREVEGQQGQYDVRANAAVVCPAASDPLTGPGWVGLGVHNSPTFTIPAGENPNTPSGDVLGVCQGNGGVIHYRGTIQAINGTAGENRTVNDVSLEAYLRGVVPRESPASWGDSGGGAGMNALRAQSVAARSYALAEGATNPSGRRYSYAKTCDTTACQVYGGAAYRGTAGTNTGYLPREHANTDAAVAQTAGKIRRWTDGRPFSVVSTEFSSSNGPRTAGGEFPAVDDPADDVPSNKLHRWTRVISATHVEVKYGLGDLVSSASERNPATTFDGIWGNQVVLAGTSGSKTVVNWDFRNAFGLPSPGFTVRVVTRGMISPEDFAFIGDSVGAGISQNGNNELPALLDGVFATARYDAVSSRCTVGCSVSPDGVGVAESLATGTELVIVELGYNDPGNFASKIDQMMEALRAKGVERVAWVNLSTRRGDAAFSTANAALTAAQGRWPELVVLDWNAASSGAHRDRWFSDDVHLTSTGDAEFSLWLRTHILALGTAGPGKLGAGQFVRVPVVGVAGVPSSDVSAVALNVTAVDPSGWGFFTVWPCGSVMPADASHVNFIEPGAVEPNSVLAPVDETGEVCVWTYEASHVLVDVNGWFEDGFEGRAPTRIVDTRSGHGAPQGKLAGGASMRVPIAGNGGVPEADASAVALNVTAVEAEEWGFFTVWGCASDMPLDASHVNFIEPGAVEPNSVLVPLDETGEICIWTYAGAHVLVDVNGWFTSGFEGRAPDRIVDTREGRGAPKGKLPAGQVLRVPVTGVGDVPASGVTAVALNVTAVEAAGWGFFTLWPCGSPMPPDASHVNFVREGAVEPNSVLALVDHTGEVCIWTFAEAHVLVDVNGWFTSGFHGTNPTRIVDTRSGQYGPL